MGFDPVTIGLALSAVGAGASIYQASEAKKAMKDAPKPAIQEPTAPPQEAKAPDYNALAKSVIGAGSNPTALTGPEGIPKEKLLLGKSTVLGA